MTASPSAPRADLLGAGLVTLAASCFATLGPLSRFADDAGVDALTLVTWRAALGAAVVLAFIGMGRAMSAGASAWQSLGAIPARDRRFMAAAASANCLLNLAAFIAFERITIAMTLLVFYLYPAGVAVASTLWFGERLDRSRWVALGVSLAGMGLVVAGAGPLGGLDLVGIGLAFVGSLCQVFYVLAARHGFAHVPGPQAAVLTMGGASILYLVIAVVVGALADLAQPVASAAAIWPVVLAGVVGAGVPTLAFILGIRRLGAPQAAIISTLEPVVGVGLAAWLLAERPTPVQVLGGALILAAAVMLQVRSGTASEHEAVEVDATDEPARASPR